MPRILTPNNSFHLSRRGSQSYHRPPGSTHRSFNTTSRRNSDYSDGGNSITQIIEKWSFNSWGQPTTTSSNNTPPVTNNERRQSPPSPTWRPPYNGNNNHYQHPRSSTNYNQTSNTRSTQTRPNSRFRVVPRRKTVAEAPNSNNNNNTASSCRSSFLPSSSQVNEDAWGQFVDTTEEDEKIIRHSRILSS
eukprot:scaffold122818_cov41-Cyclotella_meneghiniana.AAC.2